MFDNYEFVDEIPEEYCKLCGNPAEELNDFCEDCMEMFDELDEVISSKTRWDAEQVLSSYYEDYALDEMGLCEFCAKGCTERETCKEIVDKAIDELCNYYGISKKTVEEMACQKYIW